MSRSTCNWAPDPTGTPRRTEPRGYPRGVSVRAATLIDRIAEDWVDTLADLSPDVAIWLGRPGRLTEFGDHSPAGIDAHDDAARRVIARLEAAEPADDVDRVTKTDLLSDLRVGLELTDAGWPYRDVNVIASPVQEIRESFDLLPNESDDDWATIAGRMMKVPDAIAGYIETLRVGMSRGLVPARRQVVETAEQARDHGDPLGFFFDLARGATGAEGAELPASLRADLERGAERAAGAYADLARFLDTELAPRAGEDDAVGRDLYAVQSRHFLGSTIDLDETYEWGIEELASAIAEQEAVAAQIVADGSVADAVAALDANPALRLRGTDALRAWMQDLSDAAVSALAGTHFDIPEPVRSLECLIAPTQTGGIYYTGPSDDFTRPGQMWWSVPPGVTEFATWRETTTVYHEGVPGHHLQIGQAVYNRDSLNTWRRHLSGTSGHAEGWALYAERLMAELGFLDDPADRLGMLDAQRMRAARVVVDIGVHLKKPRPDGQGICDAAWALRFMQANSNMDDASIRFEVNRYLGWPGQAPSYKVGQRLWEELRTESARRQGAAFSLPAYHARVLDIGGVGLDTLRRAVIG